MDDFESKRVRHLRGLSSEPPPEEPSDPKYVLEHWKSRAMVAEKELESSRFVIRHLRRFFMRKENPPLAPAATGPFNELKELGEVREVLRTHDQSFFTREHAMDNVAAVFEEMKKEPEPEKRPCSVCGKPGHRPQDHAGWNPNDETGG